MRRFARLSPRLGSLFAAIAVLVTLLAELANVGHHVLVAHYLCAEHDTVHHGAPDAVTGVEANDPTEVDVAREPTRDEHHHDDCHWFSRITEATLESDVLRVQMRETETATTISVRAADAKAALAILSLAPKQSPTEAA